MDQSRTTDVDDVVWLRRSPASFAARATLEVPRAVNPSTIKYAPIASLPHGCRNVSGTRPRFPEAAAREGALAALFRFLESVDAPVAPVVGKGFIADVFYRGARKHSGLQRRAPPQPSRPGPSPLRNGGAGRRFGTKANIDHFSQTYMPAIEQPLAIRSHDAKALRSSQGESCAFILMA